ncbi:hypothetical protein PAEPH01_1968 [Pancytospora epiphaga]|nr:hypothetical protein PAEPH01_1968 [Pancytospora epiphaga]
MVLLVGISETELLKIAVLSLRGAARQWAASFIKGITDAMTWAEFCQGIQNRFISHKESDLALTRFLSTPEASSYDSFIQLLRDARTLKRSRGISVDHLMRQVIARSPAGLKSLLIQSVQSGASWNTFLQAAESSAWVVFPERLVNSITQVGGSTMQEVNRFSKNSNGYNKQRNGKRDQYCAIHGNCAHGTVECRLVKLVEDKGWCCNRSPGNRVNEMVEERALDNQANKNFSVNKLKIDHYPSVYKNPFFVKGQVEGKDTEVLVDTGADVTLINKALVDPTKQLEIKESRNRVSSACGNLINVLGS